MRSIGVHAGIPAMRGELFDWVLLWRFGPLKRWGPRLLWDFPAEVRLIVCGCLHLLDRGLSSGYVHMPEAALEVF